MSISIVGKKVGPIGFGLMGLGASSLSDEAAFAVIKTALGAGCNYFNGSVFYGTGPEHNSLTLLRRYFDRYPDDVSRIVLNVKGAVNAADISPNGSKEGVTSGIDDALQALGPKVHIDQFEPARKDPKQDYAGVTLAAIESYVKAGKVGAIACSEINATTLRDAAAKHKVTSVEIEFSLFHTEPLTNGLIDACGELGIPVLAYSPLGKGFLTGTIKSFPDIPEGDLRRLYPRFQPENFDSNLRLVERIRAIAEHKGCTMGQVAINWLLALSRRPGMPTIIPIPGSTNQDRIKENATVIDMSDEDMKEIDDVLREFTPVGDRYPAFFMQHVNL